MIVAERTGVLVDEVVEILRECRFNLGAAFIKESRDVSEIDDGASTTSRV